MSLSIVEQTRTRSSAFSSFVNHIIQVGISLYIFPLRGIEPENYSVCFGLKNFDVRLKLAED